MYEQNVTKYIEFKENVRKIKNLKKKCKKVKVFKTFVLTSTMLYLLFMLQLEPTFTSLSTSISDSF